MAALVAHWGVAHHLAELLIERVRLLGCVVGLLSREFGGLVLAAGLLGFSGLAVTSYWLTSRRDEDYGTTTEVSVLLTFALGALVSPPSPCRCSRTGSWGPGRR